MADPSRSRPAGAGTATAPSPQDGPLLDALRRGDEQAFAELVDAYQTQLMRVARLHVSSASAAEAVVQETWLGLLQGLDRFEGRCSLKTWLFRILLNRARTWGAREHRVVPFSAVTGDLDGAAGPAVDPERFVPPRGGVGSGVPGDWLVPPRPWPQHPEEQSLSTELRNVVLSAVDVLPLHQRTVITLRDVEGWMAPEVCVLLSLTDGHQRMLLHPGPFSGPPSARALLAGRGLRCPPPLS